MWVLRAGTEHIPQDVTDCCPYWHCSPVLDINKIQYQPHRTELCTQCHCFHGYRVTNLIGNEHKNATPVEPTWCKVSRHTEFCVTIFEKVTLGISENVIATTHVPLKSSFTRSYFSCLALLARKDTQ